MVSNESDVYDLILTWDNFTIYIYIKQIFFT